MARIDFYILNQTGARSRQAFACRLAEKAYRLANTVHIHTGCRDDAEFLDEFLWTFRDGSFVPHELLTSATAAPETPVSIGYGEASSGPRDLLINLCDCIPNCAGSFPRVAELVTSDEDCRREGRRRFVEYRDQGHALETHRV